MGEDERRLKGEVKETDRRGPALSDRTASNLRAAEEDLTFTHKRAPSPPTHSPHVDQAPAQERVQAPVDVRQAGDVEDFVTHACREQEEDVQQPVPHLIARFAAALQGNKTPVNTNKYDGASRLPQISAIRQDKLCVGYT